MSTYQDAGYTAVIALLAAVAAAKTKVLPAEAAFVAAGVISALAFISVTVTKVESTAQTAVEVGAGVAGAGALGYLGYLAYGFLLL